MAKILIVEDNEDNMKLFRTVLSLKGHDLVERVDGDGLVEAIEEEDPDLVLMDIQLPGQDGFSLLESIQSSGRKCRVVALTAHAMAGDRERAMEAGFESYITKPIDIHTFPAMIDRILAGETVTE